MERMYLTCIVCPNGCQLEVDAEDGEMISVNGNRCMRGIAYAAKEIENPTRTVTSTVTVTGGESKMVSVKTKTEISKGKIMDCMRELKQVTVEAPVRIGQVILEDVAGTGIPVVATVNVNKK